MKTLVRYRFFIFVLGLSAAMFVPTRYVVANAWASPSATASPQTGPQSASDSAPGSAQLINPEDLVNILQSPKGEKPLILNVGPHLLYMRSAEHTSELQSRQYL